MAVNRWRNREGRTARLRDYGPCSGHGAQAVAHGTRRAPKSSCAEARGSRLGTGSELDKSATKRIKLSPNPLWRDGLGRLLPGSLQLVRARAQARWSVGRAAATLAAAGEAS